MSDIDMFDPALFGVWPRTAVYGERAVDAWSDGKMRRLSGRVLLETKSAESQREELRLLLNDMTREMREQFDYFRHLRSAAEALCEAGADDAAAKLARADVKAATDAMSLIVRTLEKIDALQRQLARDRELEEERRAERPQQQQARAQFLGQIESRATEMARLLALELFEDWKRSGGPAVADTGPDGGVGPPDPAAGCAKDIGKDGEAGSRGSVGDRGRLSPAGAGDKPDA